MKGIWQSLEMLHLLWLLPLLLLLFIYDGQRRRALLGRLAQLPELLHKLTASVNTGARRWKKALVLLGLGCLIVGLARPSWNPTRREVTRRGRDVVFVLDVSKSMLADDLKPNRLERAKLAIEDCLEIMEGDRAALVAFAGTAVVKCPLTLDYGFFRMMLDDVDVSSVSRGGTMIGDAMRVVLSNAFDNQDRQFKDVILITDGEDQGSFPVEAAKKLAEKGVRLLAVGLGDESAGTSIMAPDDTGQQRIVKYRGEVVRSKLDSETLRKMAAETPGGRYLPVATGNFDLGGVYTSLIATEEKRDLESQSVELYEEKFQIFLAVAMVLLAGSELIGDRRKKSLACLFLGILMAVQVHGESLAEQARKNYEAKDYDAALEKYGELREKSADVARIIYNEGLAHYRKGDYETAKTKFMEAWEAGRKEGAGFEARCKLALGNCWYAESTRQEQSDLKKSLEACEKSIAFYDESARRDTSLTAPAKNLRMARLRLKKLLHTVREMQKQQEEQQKQRQQQQENLAKLAQRQEQAAQKSESDGEQGQQQEEQRKISEDTQAAKDEAAKQNQQQPQTGQPQQSAAEQKLDEARQEQRNAEESLSKGDMKEAAEHQREAAKKIREAKDELGDKQQQQQQGQGEKQEQQDKQGEQQQQQPQQEEDRNQQEGEQQQQQAQEAEESQDQSDTDNQVQGILDKEKDNQRRRQQQRQRTARPVDKDW